MFAPWQHAHVVLAYIYVSIVDMYLQQAADNVPEREVSHPLLFKKPKSNQNICDLKRVEQDEEWLDCKCKLSSVGFVKLCYLSCLNVCLIIITSNLPCYSGIVISCLMRHIQGLCNNTLGETFSGSIKTKCSTFFSHALSLHAWFKTGSDL